MEESLYVQVAEDRYLPTRLSQGPWSADRQHGGPVAALLARVLESAAPEGWLTAQLAVDFLSAVPLAEVAVSVETVKEGRRARCVSASLSHNGRVYARARAWQVAPQPARHGSGRSPESAAAASGCQAPPQLPEHSSYSRASFRFGYQQAVELRFVRGSFREQGPATAWARLLVPLLPATPPSGAARTAALADFGSGISAVLDRSAWTYHNLDLSVHMHRCPAGEWICLDAVSLIGPDGTGLCRTTLHDTEGPFGTAAQSLFIAAVGTPSQLPAMNS